MRGDHRREKIGYGVAPFIISFDPLYQFYITFCLTLNIFSAFLFQHKTYSNIFCKSLLCYIGHHFSQSVSPANIVRLYSGVYKHKEIILVILNMYLIFEPLMLSKENTDVSLSQRVSGLDVICCFYYYYYYLNQCILTRKFFIPISSCHSHYHHTARHGILDGVVFEGLH